MAGDDKAAAGAPVLARLFPQEQLAYLFGDGAQLLSAAGQRITIYEDKDATVLATIMLDRSRKPIRDAVVVVGEDSLIPRFWETSGRDLKVLWALAEGADQTYQLESMLSDQVAAVAEEVAVTMPATRPPRVYVQEVPATVWQWEHTLGYDPPTVLVRDPAGLVWMAEVDYPVAGSSVRVLLDDPMAGTAAYK